MPFAVGRGAVPTTSTSFVMSPAAARVQPGGIASEMPAPSTFTGVQPAGMLLGGEPGAHRERSVAATRRHRDHTPGDRDRDDERTDSCEHTAGPAPPLRARDDRVEVDPAAGFGRDLDEEVVDVVTHGVASWADSDESSPSGSSRPRSRSASSARRVCVLTRVLGAAHDDR